MTALNSSDYQNAIRYAFVVTQAVIPPPPLSTPLPSLTPLPPQLLPSPKAAFNRNRNRIRNSSRSSLLFTVLFTVVFTIVYAQSAYTYLHLIRAN